MKKTFHEPPRELPVIAETEVLVCGAGPAGIGAALQAARNGAKTMLIEYQDCLGGVATAGMMSHWTGSSSSKILREICSRMAEKSRALGGLDGQAGEMSINHEALKITLQEMMREAGVRCLFYTLACGTIVEENTLCGVIAENKSGRGVIWAKCVVDATGDGDVAASAGVEYFKGREEDQKMQPCTLMFKVGGVDYARAVFPGSFETKVPTEKGELQALAKELLPFPAGHVLLYPQHTPGTVCCNMTNCIGVDATDAVSLSHALEVCRSQQEPIVKFLREYVPGYENCWLMSSGSLLGVRETRHFKGVQSLQADDILTARVYDNWVVRRAFFNFDVHNMTGPSLDKTGIQHEWKQPESYTIPYGCLVPEKLDGLLLSGRNISGSHLAHSNFRVMPICIAVGEAAGVACALSVKTGKKLRDIDAGDIQAVVGE